ncbi:MAG TPA: hypothetical protein VJB92_01185 [Candidatus Paceibacterota bacterium]
MFTVGVIFLTLAFVFAIVVAVIAYNGTNDVTDVVILVLMLLSVPSILVSAKMFWYDGFGGLAIETDSSEDLKTNSIYEVVTQAREKNGDLVAIVRDQEGSLIGIRIPAAVFPEGELPYVFKRGQANKKKPTYELYAPTPQGIESKPAAPSAPPKIQ